MRVHASIIVLIFALASANCDRSKKSIEIDPNAATNQNSNDQNTRSTADFGNTSGSLDTYSSTDLYSASDADAALSLPNDSSLLGSGSSYGNSANASTGGLGPNDPRPPSQGMAMALQFLPQLLGCLQQRCNPAGLAQNLMGPMLAQLGAAGGQSGGLAAAGLGQIGGLLNQGIAGLQQAGAGAQYGLGASGDEEVIDEE